MAVRDWWRTRFLLGFFFGLSQCVYTVTAIDVSFSFAVLGPPCAEVCPGRWCCPDVTNPFVYKRVRPLYNGISIFKPYN